MSGYLTFMRCFSYYFLLSESSCYQLFMIGARRNPFSCLSLGCLSLVRLTYIPEPNSGGRGSIRRFEDAAYTPSKSVVKPSLILILALSSDIFSIHEGAPRAHRMCTFHELYGMRRALWCGCINFFLGGGHDDVGCVFGRRQANT